MTQSATDGPINLSDEQLDSVTGGVIRNPQEQYGDNTRNILESDMYALVQAHRNAPDNTVVLAANSQELNQLTSRMWQQNDLIFDINEVSKNGITKGELNKLLEGMAFTDETINQRGGQSVRERDSLESDIWTMVNPHRGKPEDTVIIPADSQAFKDLTLRLTPHLDAAPNLAQFSSKGFTVGELMRIANEMEMTDSMLNRRGIRTGK